MQESARRSTLDPKAFSRYLDECQIPKLYRRATIDGVKPAVWTMASVPFFRKQSLYIYGDRGVGKSCLSVVLLMQAVERRLEAALRGGWTVDQVSAVGLFGYVPDILTALEAANKFGRMTKADIIERHAAVELLILDDIGSEETTSRTIETLTTIVDRRNREMRHTIITSNLNLEQLAVKLGDRIVSRITQLCGHGRGVIQIIGEDRRLRPEEGI